jgi:hypothetical protein
MTQWQSWEPTRRQVAIAGTVTDSQSGQAIAGARVEIINAPEAFNATLAIKAIQHGDDWPKMSERPDRTCTRTDGHFHFMDLPDGDYTLKITQPGSGTRYGTAEAETTVSRDADGNIDWENVAVQLSPTAIGGTVTTQSDGGAGGGGHPLEEEPVWMAEIRVSGSGERTFSNQNGEYLLTGLEIGTRQISVTATGFTQSTPETPFSVELSQPGEFIEDINFLLA